MRPLVAMVIITAAKEEVSHGSIKRDKFVRLFVCSVEICWRIVGPDKHRTFIHETTVHVMSHFNFIMWLSDSMYMT